MSNRLATWRHPLIEGLAVLCGILVAFAIDAWWQQRTDRVTERELLRALAAELADARDGFEGHSTSLRAEFDLSAEVIRVLSSSDARSIPNDSLWGLTRRLTPPTIFHAPRAALDDLTSSGGIALIRSDPLRRGIASYRQSLEEDARVQALLLDIWLTHLAPYLYEHSTLTLPPGVSSSPGALTLPTVPLRVDRDAYLGNRTYQNLVAARAFRVQDVRRSHDMVLDQLGHLLGLVEGR